MNRVIDPWVNVDMPEWGDPDWMVAVATEYLKTGRQALERKDLGELLEEMDKNGVERVILDFNVDNSSAHTVKIAEARPDRFSLSARVDPRTIMTAVERVRQAHSSLPIVMAKVVPFTFDLPATHPSYYPLFATCVDLQLPISINTGIPGPPVPGLCQHPMHLDRVCLDFPDLQIIMAHGADPWWDEAIRLMIKYRGLHLMTSAYRPKYLPESLLKFMSTRGRSKVLFSSDWPLLGIDTCLDDARSLGLPADVLDAYLYGNAKALLFPGD